MMADGNMMACDVERAPNGQKVTGWAHERAHLMIRMAEGHRRELSDEDGAM